MSDKYIALDGKAVAFGYVYLTAQNILSAGEFSHNEGFKILGHTLRTPRSGYTVLSILSIFAVIYSVSPAFGNPLLIYGKMVTILLLNLMPVGVSLLTKPPYMVPGFRSGEQYGGQSRQGRVHLFLITTRMSVKVV